MEVQTLLNDCLQFIKDNPNVGLVIAMFVISSILSKVMEVGKWILIFWIATILLSAYTGYDVWEENQTLKSIKQSFEAEKVEILEQDGNTFKAVVDGVTKVLKVQDGTFVEVNGQ